MMGEVGIYARALALKDVACRFGTDLSGAIMSKLVGGGWVEGC